MRSFKSPAVVLAIIGLFFSPALGHCPNSCSGRGKCTPDDVCQCYREFSSSPDCSKRSCPYAPAWADIPTKDGEGYALAECSNKGTCDRTSGQCKCFPGYTGHACQRMECLNSCSGHGYCRSMDEVAGIPPSSSESMWASEKSRVCVCDDGYEGIDCSLRTCPRGDDPLTEYQKDPMVQYLVVGDGFVDLDENDILLTFYDTYGGIWKKSVSLGSDTDATKNAVREALKSVPNFRLTAMNVEAVDSLTGADLPVYNPVTRRSTGTLLKANAKQQIFKITFNSAVPGESGRQKLMGCDLVKRAADANLAPLYRGVDLTSASNQMFTVNQYDTNLQLKLNQDANSLPSTTQVSSHLDYAKQMGIPIEVVFNSDFSCSLRIAPTAAITVNTGVYTIPVLPDESCPPLEGSTSLSGAYAYIGSLCTAFEAFNADAIYSENNVCSDRGICNTDSGECMCFEGFRGLACGTQDALV